jgi:predicted Rossmann fold nucleotide-binding protein DprA/Smf involved in DNA uptake
MAISRIRLGPNDSAYPARLRQRSPLDSLPLMDCIGNLALLAEPSIGLICSRQCPGRLVNATYDLAQRWRDAQQPVIGGFHSPMEQECLRLLLRGAQPVIICPARSIEDYRIPGEWQPGLTAGRVLVLSPFTLDERRVTAELAERRNRFVADLAAEVFIAYAAPDSATLRFAESLAAVGTPLITHDAPENAALISLGARSVAVDDYAARTDLRQMPLFDG